ncbi:MAG: 30S ribosomal protein S18 [Roseiflexus sp.]|nr:30S ribosomal protein S18 [Roseiflexus sp.]MDW8144790.1 30S ribosomal protein S18 [Roseiflexaceae bacterium]
MTSQDGGRRVRGRVKHKKVCEFSRLGILPDYKDPERLKRFLGPTGKILPRRRIGLTAKMQRQLTIAIKRARHMALLPFAERSATERRR